MKERTQWIRATGVLALSLSLLAPTRGRAQSADPQRISAATTLYDQANAEMDAKNYASACPKLEEVQRLLPEGLGAKLTLAECYEGLGRLASAWSQYTLVEALARKAGQAAEATEATTKAAKLRPRLATLTIEVPPKVRGLAGLAITRDGVAVGEVQWSIPVPVDKGAHEIMATAADYKPSKQRIEVAKDGEQVSFAVKPLEAAPRLPAVGDAPPVRPWQRPLGLAVLGVGAAGVGVGAVLGVLALGKNGASNADNHCFRNNRCDPTGLELRKAARGLGNGSTAAFVVGGVVLAGGAVLFVTAPPSVATREREGAPRAGLRAEVALGLGGLQVQGVW